MNTRNPRTLKRKKEKKRIRFAVFMILIFISASAAMYFFIKHAFVVKEIVFIGNRHLKNEEIKTLIGLNKGDEIFGVSGGEIYRRLKSSQWIKDAVIRKELSGPGEGRVLVNIKEAVPVAILSMEGMPYLIDKDGVILEQMREGTVLFLPVIKEINPYKDRHVYAEAVKFAGILRNKKVLSYGGNVEVTGQRPEDITLKVGDIFVKIGTGDFDKKLERLEFVKDEIEKRGIPVEYIDLRFANKIIVKPVGSIIKEQLYNK